MRAYLLPVLSSILGLALANVEKTIFLGPSTAIIPSHSPTVTDLNIDTLTPSKWSIRTHLTAAFPTADSPRGVSTWLFLDGLEVDRRYEVRICWIATQPTAFKLSTHTLDKVFETPELITSLYNYSMSRQLSTTNTDTDTDAELATTSPFTTTDREASVLFLHIQAAAEYYSSNKSLMVHVPAVYVDIILDPFLLNVLPRSLLPTACYILFFVAPLSYLLGRYCIMPTLREFAASDDSARSGDEKKVQ